MPPDFENESLYEPEADVLENDADAGLVRVAIDTTQWGPWVDGQRQGTGILSTFQVRSPFK